MAAATAPRKICIVTGTRAEYGLLQPLMTDISADASLVLQVIATGAHLSPEFGSTYQAIERDGFTLDAKVEMLLSADSTVGVTKSTGLGVMGFADAFARLQPDIVVLLGDRFETLAAAQAALLARIPIAHLHGGEVSAGAFDESIRHAITKMAQWHFVAAEPYRKRVVQMGEAPQRVFNVGAPGLDHLQHLKWLERSELEQSLGMPLAAPLFLVTYHPVTLAQSEPVAAMNELLAALDAFPEATVVCTCSNADPGGRALIERMNHWAATNKRRAKAFVSLGTQRYLSLMRLADVVIGNSSSALIEAPALKRAAVNVGERQAGRLKAASVIDAAEQCDAIVAAITRALSREFRAALPTTESLYGSGGAARKIRDTLKTVALGVHKQFFDIEHGH